MLHCEKSFGRYFAIQFVTDDASAKLLVDKKFSEIMGNDRRFGNIELLYTGSHHLNFLTVLAAAPQRTAFVESECKSTHGMYSRLIANKCFNSKRMYS